MRTTDVPTKTQVDAVCLTAAVRYSLGRNTYMPRVAADNVRANLDVLGSQREVIKKDLGEWLNDEGILHPCQITWSTLLNDLLDYEKDMPGA